MRICIYGGSFNPVHKAHIYLARTVIKQGLADEVWMMLTPQNPLKEKNILISDDRRFEILEKAIDGERNIKASNFELSMPRPTYTINTLKALKKAYPEHQFSLLIGADNWKDFSKWRQHEEIIDNNPIIIYPRKGYAITESDLPSGIRLLKTRLRNISSSEIRSRISEGKDISLLVPKNVISDVLESYRKQK